MMVTVATFTIENAKAQFYGVRVNTLGLATGTLNAGVEITTGKLTSVDIAIYHNPISTDKLSAKFTAVQAGVRYWRYETSVGHFAGAYLTYANYDTGNKTHRFKGDLFGIGFTYGYTWLLSDRWNLTAEGGPGVYYMKDTKTDKHIDPLSDERIIHRKRVRLLPSRLELSFSYLF